MLGIITIDRLNTGQAESAGAIPIISIRTVITDGITVEVIIAELYIG